MKDDTRYFLISLAFAAFFALLPSAFPNMYRWITIPGLGVSFAVMICFAWPYLRKMFSQLSYLKVLPLQRPAFRLGREVFVKSAVALVLFVLTGHIIGSRVTNLIEEQTSKVAEIDNSSVQAQPNSGGVLTVRNAKDCPTGYSIIESSLFYHNGVGISAPANAHICLVDNNFQENGKGIELRDPHT